MIGMSQIKRKTLQGVLIGAAIGVVGIGITIFVSYNIVKSYADGSNKTYQQKYTTNVAVLTKDVIQGEIITDDIVTNRRIHNSTVPEGALTSGEIVGKVAKYSIAANVALTNSMITEEIIDADIRMQEVNTILMPSDLNVGESIDIRIMFPNGTDYIVLSQKRAEQIQGETLWLQLSEDERLLLNSAVVDSFLTQGTKLYATKYVDQDAQIKATDDAAQKAQGYVTERIKTKLDTIKSADEAELTNILFELIKEYKNFATTVTRTKENYQPNTYVINAMKSNANILEQAKNKLNEDARKNIENSILDYANTNEEEYSNVVSSAKEAISAQKTQREELVNSNIGDMTVE